jgi:hypothetical protein
MHSYNGKIAGFLGNNAGYYQKMLRKYAKGCRPGVEAGFGGAEPGDQKRPTSLRLISRGVRR